jgi:hypothetical protein
LNWLLEELKKFDQFAGTRYSMFPESEEDARGRLLNLIREHVFLVAERASERVGFVAGFIFQHHFNKDLLCLQECFWWVMPKYRGSSAGIRLLDAFKLAGESLEVDWIYFSMLPNTPASDRALLRRGFKLQDRLFLLEVPHGDDTDRCGIASVGSRRRRLSSPSPQTAQGSGERTEESDPSATPGSHGAGGDGPAPEGTADRKKETHFRGGTAQSAETP